MIPSTRRKFLKSAPGERHKQCAQLLREAYERLVSKERVSLERYTEILSWMDLEPLEKIEPKEIANRYHWHLEKAGRTLKEHNLLPSLRTGDRTPKADYLPIALYLDNIRSAYNVGSILRTCEALRIGSIHFAEKTPFLDNEKVERTAMGAASLVSCHRGTPLSSLPRPILVLDTSDEAIPLSDYLFPSSFTLVLGNEEVGVSDASLALADTLLEIPLLGAKNSLNVACAFAIAAAQIRTQFKLALQ